MIIDVVIIVAFVLIVIAIIWLNTICGSTNSINKGNEHFITLPSTNYDKTIDESKFSRNDKVVEYGNYICHRKDSNIEPISKPIVPIKFSNKCVKKNDNDLIPNNVCNQQSSNTDNSNFQEEKLEIDDPSKYYHEMYTKMSANFDDGRFAGYNYYAFPGFDNLKNIGPIPLQKTVNYPIGTSD